MCKTMETETSEAANKQLLIAEADMDESEEFLKNNSSVYRHQNLVQYFGYHILPEKLCLIMEFPGIPVFELVTLLLLLTDHKAACPGHFEFEFVSEICFHVLKGLEFLLSQNVFLVDFGSTFISSMIISRNNFYS